MRGVGEGVEERWILTSAARAAASLASFSRPAAAVVVDPNVRPCPCPFGICARGVCVGAAGAEEEEEEPTTRPGVEKLSGLLDEREQRLPIFGGRGGWMGWDGMGLARVVGGFEGGG